MKNLYTAIVIAVVIFILFMYQTEYYYLGPSYHSVFGSYPVPYGSYPKKYSGAHHVRRWRTPVRQGTHPLIRPRQVSDDIWHRAYQSGRGLQLG